MTQLLATAIEQIQKLPEAEQDAIASLILAQLDEQSWDESFARSQEPLAKLADQARADIAAGRVRPLRRPKT